MNKLTLTIGIPAYNEQANIKKLVISLLAQKQESYDIEKIIVVSDGSTDNTNSIVKGIKNSTVFLVENEVRQGKANALNVISELSNSEILVLVDADILIRNSDFIEKLIEPICKSGVDLTSARVNEYWSISKFEQVLKVSMMLKKDIFEHFNHGNNIYTCHGRSRAMTKKLYKKMKLDKALLAEDAYAYIFAIQNGYRYAFARKANLYYKLPQTFDDHMSQSVRFINSFRQLEDYFPKADLNLILKLPKRISLKYLVKYFLRFPLTMAIYVGVLLRMRFISISNNGIKPTWDIAKSSKSFTK